MTFRASVSLRLAVVVAVAAFAYGDASLRAAPLDAGRVSGIIVGRSRGQPLPFVNVTLTRSDGAGTAQRATTDANGAFAFEGVSAGDYALTWSLPNAEATETRAVHLDAALPALELGTLTLADDAVKMDVMVVSADKSAFYNSIDRKVYNVGESVLGATGSASDVLQNIPSVSLDIDGVVSLRGSESVTILVDGRATALMGANRAAALGQMPAGSIERIEVITNPSAKYKPDGTAGIINIVLKKKREPGFSGSWGINVGNDERINSSLSLSAVRGRSTFSGSYGVRQDDRWRRAAAERERIDSASGAAIDTTETTDEHSRPLSHIVRAGWEHRPDERNTIGLTSSYNHRRFTRRELTRTLTAENGSGSREDFDRSRFDFEFERDFEAASSFRHAFAKEDHELNLEFKLSRSAEQQDNRYTNVFRTPAALTSFDNTLIKTTSAGSEFVAEYVLPLADDAKFESGYTREADRIDADFLAEFFDPAVARWVRDTAKSNRFIVDETVHAGYATYGRPVGRFGFLAGVRLEQAFLDSHLVNTNATIPNDYFRLYPSLHLSWRLGEGHELQLNYSHRVNRPDGEDLNPFPEYRDPRHLRAGNPHLRPEDIHSYEFGYQFTKDETSVVTTAYYRDLYHGFAEVTRALADGTLLATQENLSQSRSLGIECAADAAVTKWATLNFSSNMFFNTIDASNLGFSDQRSAVSWIAKLGASLHVAPDTLVQINANFTSSKLTPQGRRGATQVINLGVRRKILQKRAALVLTVSDVFDSLKERTILETADLREIITRRRRPRVAYMGFVYEFGRASKKAKDEPLTLDEAP